MLQVLHTPVALTIPDAPQENAPEPIEDSPEQQMDPIQIVREVKTFAKVCGGLDAAERMVEAIQAMTISLPQLAAWIKELRDE